MLGRNEAVEISHSILSGGFAMTWLAQSDRMAEQRKFGSHQGTGTGADPAALMVQGSIIVDLDFALSNQAPCKLISYVLDKGWRREFTVFLNADLSLSVEVIQGQSRCYGQLVDCTCVDIPF